MFVIDNIAGSISKQNMHRELENMGKILGLIRLHNYEPF